MSSEAEGKTKTDTKEEEKVYPEEKGAQMMDFWTEWCGHCKMMMPVVDKLVDEWKGRVKIRKVHADAQRNLALKHRVTALPTFIFLLDGKEVDRVVGATTKEHLGKKLEELAKQNESK